MLLFKYFEKRAKDGLPDPNGPLSSRVPSDESVGKPTGIRGSRSSYLLSRQHLKERKVHKIGTYIAIKVTQHFMPVTRHV